MQAGGDGVAVDAAVEHMREITRKDLVPDVPGMAERAVARLRVRIERFEPGAAVDVDHRRMGVIGGADPPDPRPQAEPLRIGDLQHLVVAVGVVGDPQRSPEQRAPKPNRSPPATRLRCPPPTNATCETFQSPRWRTPFLRAW